MSKVTELTREKVLETICKATRANTLGLFIGSGFTKAMYNTITTTKHTIGENCFHRLVIK